MNSKQNSSYIMVVRADKFLADNTAKVNTAAQALVPGLVAGIAEIDAFRKKQAGGSGRFAAGVAERRLIAKKLRRKLADVAQTARILAKGPNPGLDQELHVPRNPSYSTLLGAGDSFVETLTPNAVKTAYTTRGYDATFVEDLAALVAKFRAATDRKFGGLNDQVGSTGGLIAVIRSAVEKVRDLDAILSPVLRENDPEGYTGWKAAIHIGRLPTRKRAKPTKAKAEPVAVPGSEQAAGDGSEQSAAAQSEQSPVDDSDHSTAAVPVTADATA